MATTQPDTGIIGSQLTGGIAGANVAQAPNADPVTANKADVTTATASNAGLSPNVQAGTATSTNANAGQIDISNPVNKAIASTYDPAMTSVEDKSTVQGQVYGIIAKNSPLMQQAQTRALEQMNSRGLLNSSMAVGAGQGAVMDKALPIAQQDAATNWDSNKTNAAATNRAGEFNAGVTTDVSKANAGIASDLSKANAAMETQVSLSNAQTATDVSKYNVQAALQAGIVNKQQADAMAQFNAQQATNVSIQNAAQANDVAKFNVGEMLKANIINQDQANKLNQFNAEQYNKASQFNASETNDILKAQLDANTKVVLGNIEAQYKTTMQASASAADLYKQVTANMTDIMKSNTMDAASKGTAIANQMALLKSGMQINGAITQLDLGALLNFGPLPGQDGVGVTGAPGAPAPGIVNSNQATFADQSGY